MMERIPRGRANWSWRPVRLRLYRRDPRVARLLAVVAAAHDIPAEMLLASSRCRADIAVARRLAMYLMHVVLRRSPLSIAKLFRRHTSSVIRACYAIEDLREDGSFDAIVDGLEKRIRDEAMPVPCPTESSHVVG